jgi:aspartate racemase
VSRVGLVGGLGPESTIDYYRRILERWAEDRPGSAPGVVIDSLDVQQALRLVQQDRAALVDYLAASLARLAGAGADFAVLTANTPHLVFDELVARSPLPLLSIVETCADAAERLDMKRLLLLGTRFTMDGPSYPEVFGRRGLGIVTPEAADVTWVHDRYVGELLKGEFRDDTRQGFVALIERVRDASRIEAVILGGSELPLLLRAPEIAGIPLLDTTTLHVEAIVSRLLAG